MNRRQVLRTLAIGAASIPLAHRAALSNPPIGGALPPDPRPPGGGAAAGPAGPFAVPPLGYAFDALEPDLDAQTMQIHHDKHHAAYVTNLNKAVAGRAEVAGWTLDRLLRELDRVPADIRTAVQNHGGGHANHSMLWTSLKKGGGKVPAGELARAVDAAFGSFAAFQDKFAAAAQGVFGSGWAWLSTDAKGVVSIEKSANQDSPLTLGRTPLLGIDVWEHAYYLKFQNRRADYVAAFANVVDWDAVSARYRDAVKG